MNWNKRLTQAREAREIKKSPFARKVGVAAATVTQWEGGLIKKIEGDNLMKVCAELRITPEWLLNGTGAMNDLLTEGHPVNTEQPVDSGKESQPTPKEDGPANKGETSVSSDDLQGVPLPLDESGEIGISKLLAALALGGITEVEVRLIAGFRIASKSQQMTALSITEGALMNHARVSAARVVNNERKKPSSGA